MAPWHPPEHLRVRARRGREPGPHRGRPVLNDQSPCDSGRPPRVVQASEVGQRAREGGRPLGARDWPAPTLGVGAAQSPRPNTFGFRARARTRAWSSQRKAGPLRPVAVRLRSAPSGGTNQRGGAARHAPPDPDPRGRRSPVTTPEHHRAQGTGADASLVLTGDGRSTTTSRRAARLAPPERLFGGPQEPRGIAELTQSGAVCRPTAFSTRFGPVALVRLLPVLLKLQERAGSLSALGRSAQPQRHRPRRLRPTAVPRHFHPTHVSTHLAPCRHHLLITPGMSPRYEVIDPPGWERHRPSSEGTSRWASPSPRASSSASAEDAPLFRPATGSTGQPRHQRPGP